MATPEVLQREADLLLSSPLIELHKGENGKSRGLSIEKKIELLESLTGKVTNRRSRRWLNDRLLMELVPRLNAEEIRGLFAPPPWGDDVPTSAFCMTNGGEWDKFRTIDMDKEANIIGALNNSSRKKKFHVDGDKMAVLNAWRRIDCRTREALRRSFLSELISGYEDCIRTFIKESVDGDVLTLQVQDPFHRLLLHGVCEFYNLVSVTVTQDAESPKVTRIKKKKMGVIELPNITLSHFLKMSKEGIWLMHSLTQAFKGNPAAVCLLEEERDEKWLQAEAAEFNISVTCYLTRITDSASPNPRFRLRWFTPVAEVPDVNPIDVSKIQNGGAHECFIIELNFPAVPITNSILLSVVMGGYVLKYLLVKRTIDLQVVLPSGKSVTEPEPQFGDILKCPGRGLNVSGIAPPDSEFDFITRFFCPKYGINEKHDTDMLKASIACLEDIFLRPYIAGSFLSRFSRRWVVIRFVEVHIVPWHPIGAKSWENVISLHMRHHLEVEY
ncbi:hypothetical protein REPUB_Repub12eG0121600 [Reevesia pubescens]